MTLLPCTPLPHVRPPPASSHTRSLPSPLALIGPTTPSTVGVSCCASQNPFPKTVTAARSFTPRAFCMLQQPLHVATTHNELPQLRRVTAYMVCPSRQAACYPKPPSPVALAKAFLVSSEASPKPFVTQPTSSGIPAIPAAFRSHRWSALCCQRCQMPPCFL